MKSLATFRSGGLFLPSDHKAVTAVKPIARFVPKEVTIPLSQHLGKPAKPIVARKQKVTRGDLIGEAGESGAPVHASVSGVVKRVAMEPHPVLVEGQAVVIETDPLAVEPVWEESPDWQGLSKEVMLERIAMAGIVGLGGAGFPTHRKLKTACELGVDTLILNGAECEPFLTSDHRLLLEHPKEIFWGAHLLAKITGASAILIGIEENQPDVAENVSLLLKHWEWKPKPRLVICRTKYPQGSEKQLVEALAGRRVPAGKLPLHVGCLVQNVATAQACCQAIRFRKPLLDRVLTVSGSGIFEPKNVSVPLGTLMTDLVAFCGGLHPQAAKVIAGGPMMGKTLGRLDVPIIKGIGGLTFLNAKEISREVYGPCISCGRCLEACPIGCQPNQISIHTEAGLALETERFGTKECFECGCCAYVCPALRPLVQFIQASKEMLRRKEQ